MYFRSDKLLFSVFCFLFGFQLFASVCSAESISTSVSINHTEASTSAQLNEKAYGKLQAGRYDELYALATRAIELAILEKNKNEHARAISNLASSLLYLGEQEKALKLYSKSLSISESNSNFEGVNRALNNIASVYDTLGNHQEVLKYRELLLRSSIKSGIDMDKLLAYIGLISSYANLSQVEKSKLYVKKATELNLEISSSFHEIYILYAETALFDQLNQNDRSIKNTKRALEIAKKNNFRGLIATSHTILAGYYFEEQKYLLSISHSKMSLNEASKLGLKSKQIEAHKLLSNNYEKLGSFEKALQHNKLGKGLSTSIIDERIRILAEVTKIDRKVAETKEMLLESQKDQKILMLQLKQQNQSQLIGLIAIAIIAILFFFLFYWYMNRKELARQVALNQQLKELDYVKDRVLTNTSHELRTPLNGIIGLSDIILQDDDNNLPQPTRDSIQLIKASGEQLALVVNDILEMSKLKSNKVTVIKSRFELVELIQDVVKVCSPAAREKDLSLSLNSDVQTWITQDRTRLQQVLFNLIGNAVKFTDKGQVKVTVHKEQNEIKILINDSGIGIPKDKQERIFEGFEQVESSDSRSKSGSGLGLAISRGIVKALGGTISLTSEFGSGTEVTITLPC